MTDEQELTPRPAGPRGRRARRLVRRASTGRPAWPGMPRSWSACTPPWKRRTWTPRWKRSAPRQAHGCQHPYREITGGAVEADESPYDAAVRELKEELGLTCAPGRLLAVDWVPPRRTRGNPRPAQSPRPHNPPPVSTGHPGHERPARLRRPHRRGVAPRRRLVEKRPVADTPSGPRIHPC
jgi:hypothetical protein